MGLFSSIKKGFKKFMAGVAKVFEPVIKPFRKLLENKWVRGILMAVTIFTGVGAIMSGFAAGGFGGALGALGKLALNVVKTPFDLIAGGFKAVGGLMSGAGAQGLGNWVQGIGQGLQTRVDSIANATSNVFANVVTPGAAPNGLTQPPAVPGAPTPPPVPQGASPVPGAPGNGPGVLDQAPANAPALETAPSRVPTPQGASPAVLSGAVETAKPSLFKRALTWAEKNPELTKMGVDAVASMTAPDEPSKADEMKARDAMWRKAGDSTGARPLRSGLLSQLRERNAEMFEQARQSSQRLMQVNTGADTPVNFV